MGQIMAVYTDINEDELTSFLTDYSIGALQSYRGIAEGVENSNFMLHTEAGRFILTLFEKRVNKKDLPFYLELMNHLALKGISCPQPIKRKDGKMIGELVGRPATIVSFLEGVWLRKPNVEHCREVGKGMAKMHLAGLDFPLKRKNSLSIDAWRPLWNLSRGRAEELASGLVKEIDRELDYLESNWPDNLPQGVIHADFFNDNVFFLNDHMSGIIDFYFACTDMLSYDLVIALNAWCFERDYSYNVTKSEAMLKAYCAIRPLQQNEIDNILVLARGAAIRFFLTRLYDWFNTPSNSLVVKKDPLEYWRKLNFFRDVIKPSEIGL
ncbi:MAG: homoserine kinase [Bifidobacteriales bacterium]|uniref:Homoserine kinase n=2 Tax=Bartonellaceae TaxID=772 RepID=A0A1R0F8K2_9HYPH|nr:homoserine kinase [Bifidobacteriales bacterium]OLY43259.1 homoserine kinase [Bartonella apis]OLY45191.1 homoserine kinase [Bartonella apis]